MKERVKGAFTKKKIFHFLKMALFVVALSLILLSLLGTVAHATGLVDDTINAENLENMFKKNKKQTETIKEPKEKKVRTVKVGTHKKAVIALWVVLIASVSFGVYKNFTAIDQHTTHEKEIIELRLQDTNGIENFVKNFAKSYYTWNNSKEAIEARTQAINGYLTKELQDLNVDTIRTDIPTSSTVTDVIVWNIEQSGTDTFSATYEVDQQIKEGEQTTAIKATYGLLL